MTAGPHSAISLHADVLMDPESAAGQAVDAGFHHPAGRLRTAPTHAGRLKAHGRAYRVTVMTWFALTSVSVTVDPSRNVTSTSTVCTSPRPK